MDEEWVPIENFENYMVSTFGRVYNSSSDKIVKESYNHQGIAKVNLFVGSRVYCRSVSLLVANAFLPPPAPTFTSVINLNGDKRNNTIDNLIRRPRWFVTLYTRQFQPGYAMRYRKPIRDCQTGVIYPNSLVVSTTFGVLDRDLYLSILNRTYVFPTNQTFEFVEN